MVVRRSSRAKKPTASIYDDAKKDLELASPRSRPKALKEDDHDSDDDDDDDEESGKEEQEEEQQADENNDEDNDDASSSSSSDDDDDDDFGAPPKKKTPPRSPRKSITGRTPNSKIKAPPARKIRVRYTNPALVKRNAKKKASALGKPSKSLANAMAALARKVLEPTETPETSLAAALLDIGTPKPPDPFAEPRSRAVVHRLPQVVRDQIYDDDLDDDYSNIQHDRPFRPPGLEELARNCISEYQANPSAMQVQLMNLVFRSVGGRHLLDPVTADLDDMDDDQWEAIVTKIVDDMRHTPPDQILWCAHPQGAIAAAKETAANSNTTTPATTTHASLGAATYRLLFSEFWYMLGCVGLAGTTQVGGGPKTNKKKQTKKKPTTTNDDKEDGSNDGDSDHSDSDDDSEDNDAPLSSRFAIELVRDVAIRMMELITVGQPDVRGAATVAVLQLAHASLDWTLDWQARLVTAQRQYKAAAQVSKSSSKTAALKYQVDSLTRTLKEVEEMVISTGVKGVFMRRYRDANAHIRAMCMQSLSKWTLQRPDLFLKDTHLKYFGWLAHDKHPAVRMAALQGLLAPLQRAQEQKTSSNSKAANSMVMTIDPYALTNVIKKFLNRIAECVSDVDKGVQEVAMTLLLRLLRDGFLDDVDDDNFWIQINMRALGTNSETTPQVRRDALHFVVEQLEAFDCDLSQKAPESRLVEQIDALAIWVAHVLSEGKIPVSKMRVDRVVYVMQSLRDMPQLCHLATSWSALLKTIQNAIRGDGVGGKSGGADQAISNAGRVDVAKQRVLLQMLTYAAELEVGGEDENYDDDDLALTEFLDPDFVAVKRQVHLRNVAQHPFVNNKQKRGGKKKRSQHRGIAQEALTLGLLRALPEFLDAFAADVVILRSLTALPRYFAPHVLSLPPRKDDVQKLLKVLSKIFQESTDTTCLNNICLALTFLARADHARNREALLELKTLTGSIRNRLELLYKDTVIDDTSTLGSPSSLGSTAAASLRRSPRSPKTRGATSVGCADIHSLDKEHSIYLCLKRLRIVSKRWYLGDLLETDRTGEDSACAFLCSFIARNMAKKIKAREVPTPREADDDSSVPSVVIPEIWTTCDERTHAFVAKSVGEGLNIILSVTAWKLNRAMQLEKIVAEKKKKARKGNKDDIDDSDDDDNDTDDDDTNVTTDDIGKATQSIVRLRDGLSKLLILCFDQYVDEQEFEGVYSKEHLSFASIVQLQAGRCAADLRSLFPREWVSADSPLLRACALTDDPLLIGGYVRFFRSQEDAVASIAQGRFFVHTFMLHLCRCVAANWSTGNRREAGTAIAHAACSGDETTKAVLSLLKVLRKIDPVRALEAHMACLRQCYADWVGSEPPELESDRPSEDELAAFEEAEKAHEEYFKAIELKAAKLSAALGVGKLNDKKKVEPALIGFFKEGIRFAFSNEEPGSEDELLIGSRLSFLTILGKYATWAKKQKSQFKSLQALFMEKEADLLEQPDFDEIRKEDLEALAAFRKLMGLKEAKQTTRHASAKKRRQAEEEEDGDDKMSVEGDDEDEEDDQHSAGSAGTGGSAGRSRKRRTSRASVGSNRSGMSGQLSPLAEESEESLSPQKKRKLEKAIKEGSDESPASSDEESA